MTLKRYAAAHWTDLPDGEWVRYADVETLERQCQHAGTLAAEWKQTAEDHRVEAGVQRTRADNAQADAENWRRRYSDGAGKYVALETRLAAANAEVERLRGELTHITGLLDRANAALEQPYPKRAAVEQRVLDAVNDAVDDWLIGGVFNESDVITAELERLQAKLGVK